MLRGVEVNRANQAWGADITCIPMVHGFMYLVAIMDWSAYGGCAGVEALEHHEQRFLR